MKKETIDGRVQEQEIETKIIIDLEIVGMLSLTIKIGHGSHQLVVKGMTGKLYGVCVLKIGERIHCP